jgi:N utilization substance protein B
VNPAGLSLARRAAVQAIYQWQITGMNPAEIERQFFEEHGIGGGDPDTFKALLHGIPEHVGRIDAALGEYLDRPIGEVDPVERAILRIGAFELLFRPQLPYRVVLNEAIKFAKEFGAEQGYRYVNGILDRVARQHRAAEIGARPEPRPNARRA